MEYKNYAYLWPPRPEKKIPSSFLNMYEGMGWVGQFKKNGTCNVLFVSPAKEITVMSRHGEPHKAWSPTNDSSRVFKSLPGNGWYVIITEVMNNKVAGIRDTHYIFDILVNNGDYLVGRTFTERMTILKNLFLYGDEEETDSHYIVNDNVWLAKVITGDFLKKWKETDNAAKASDSAPENEGLVLKDPNAPLKLCNTQKSNGGWQVKCRVSHKNYTF